MTIDECHERAGQCAANAELAVSEPLRLEFMRLAAQWRAMAVRTIFLGSVEAALDPAALRAPTAPLA